MEGVEAGKGTDGGEEEGVGVDNDGEGFEVDHSAEEAEYVALVARGGDAVEILEFASQWRAREVDETWGEEGKSGGEGQEVLWEGVVYVGECDVAKGGARATDGVKKLGVEELRVVVDEKPEVLQAGKKGAGKVDIVIIRFLYWNPGEIEALEPGKACEEAVESGQHAMTTGASRDAPD